jgi:hypothetical protein
MRTLLVALPVLLVSLAGACGPPPRPSRARDSDLRTLGETRALEMIREVTQESSIACGDAWRVDVGESDPEQLFDVDLRLADSAYGVEWVTSQDRADWGRAIPQPDRGGQLRIMPGARDDRSAQILILDERSYRYDPDSDRVRAGSVGPREAEDRLRRDVRDFLEYVRGQGAL